MITSVKRKGLRKFWETGKTSGLQQMHVGKIKAIMTLLETARTPDDMNFPGSKLHPLKGDLKEFWSVTVRANWRIIFKIKNGDVYELDYIDYH